MKKIVHLQTEHSSLYTIDNFISEDDSEALYKYFSSDDFPLIPNPEIIVYGRKCTTHRRTGFFSNISEGYSFAGQIAVAQPLTHILEDLINRVNSQLNTNFNGVLINDYRDGIDYIGPHSDNEKTLDRGIVAGISLGASRKFRIRDKQGKHVLDIKTQSGQLLVMDGNFQKEFKHEIPIEKKIKTGRISLTFRMHNY